MPSFYLFQTPRLIGFPGVAARALPVEVSCLEAANLASVAIQPLSVAVDDGTQQTEIRPSGDLQRGGRRNRCARGTALQRFGIFVKRRVAGSQFDFKEAVQAEHGRLGAQRFTGKSPRGTMPLLTADLPEQNIEDIQRRVARIVVAQ